MEFTTTYILSQVFTITMYVLLAATYYAKDRKKVLILNFLGLIAIGIAYIFLNAWSGVSMCIVSLFRNVIFIIDEHKHGNMMDLEVYFLYLLLCYIHFQCGKRRLIYIRY